MIDVRRPSMPRRARRFGALAALALLPLATPRATDAQSITDAVARPPASQGVDAAYGEAIRRFTTEPFFLTPLIDHLPASSTVPTPLQHNGYIAGAADVLTYPEQIYSYMRAVAAASPRVRVETIGQTEEGREMMVVIIADEQTIARLDDYKGMLRQLADPRRTSAAQAESLFAQAKPVYYATAAMHSPETGSPEMSMELVYRLAVSEAPFIREIRENVITMITPVVEVDGRAKQVDLHMAPRRDPNAHVSPRLLFWGKYVAHDNNRDGMALQLAITQNIMRTFLDWNPTVLHDLHESASYLYTSTGRGPYNAWVDPIVINEWNRLAYKEVNDMTALGVPGVYTYDFYDGWAPNYMFWIANMRNSIGRFYETQGSRNAANYLLNTNVQRSWHRPNTPLSQVVWSIRNNVNLQQSGLLIALNEVAVNREEYLRNFYRKSERSIAKATSEGPAAWVFPASDPRPGQQARLLSLFQRHGIEVHRADRAFTAGGTEYGAGSYVVRMDQPYSRTADMMLDRQYYNPDDPRPYDDAGWTHGPLFNVETVRVEDSAVLRAPMQLVRDAVRPPGAVTGASNATAFLIDYNADNNLAAFRYRHRDMRIRAAQRSFEAGGRSYRAGSFVVDAGSNGGAQTLRDALDSAAREFGFTAVGVTAAPQVPTHEVAAPRVAVMHTWLTTQTEGWLRLGLEEYGVPFDYISVHAVRDDARLRDKYDVILFGPSSADALSIVRGAQGATPQPWMRTEITPNLGSETSTPDMRGGLELQGVLNLSNFVQQGGTLVTLTSSSSLPTHFGMAGNVSIRDTPDLWARGGVFRTVAADNTSPIAYGYGEELGVYFNTGPVFAVGGGGFGGGGGGGAGAASADPGATTARTTGRGGNEERDIIQGRARDMGQELAEAFRREQAESGGAAGGGSGAQAGAGADVRTVLRFSPDPRTLLISGGLAGGAALAGAPALVDVRHGDGHVVMFSFNPFWRGGTLGSYALLFNTLLHHGNLDAGRAAPRTTNDNDGDR